MERALECWIAGEDEDAPPVQLAKVLAELEVESFHPLLSTCRDATAVRRIGEEHTRRHIAERKRLCRVRDLAAGRPGELGRSGVPTGGSHRIGIAIEA